MKLRLSMIGLALAASLSAQLDVTLCNESDLPQMCWVDVALPRDLARKVPRLARMDPQGWLVARGRDVGEHSTMIHVLAGVSAKSEATGWLTHLEAPRRATRPSSDPLDEPLRRALPRWRFWPSRSVILGRSDLIPELSVDGREIPLASMQVKESHVGRQVWEMKFVGRGFVAHVWSTLYSIQDVVPCTAQIVWSDRNDPGYTKDVQSVQFAFGPAVEVHSRFARAEGWSTGGGAIQWHPPGGKMGDGEIVPFRAELFVIDPSGNGSPLGDRLNNGGDPFVAARGGPVRGVSRDWDGHWLIYGGTPPVPQSGRDRAADEHHAFMNRLQTAGSMFDLRPLGAPGRAANAGKQHVFAMGHAGVAVSLFDPRQIDRMAFSMNDIALRPEHHFERDGSLVTTLDHPNLCTWDRRPHRCGTDRLGKGGFEAPMYGVSGRTGRDDQHLDSWIHGYLALTGDYAAEQWLRSMTWMDAAQERAQRNKMGMQRAVGRVTKYLANTSLLLDGPERDAAIDTLEKRVKSAWDHWAGKSASGPVKSLGPYLDWRGIVINNERHETLNVSFEVLGFLGIWAASRALEEGSTWQVRSRQMALEGLESFVMNLTFQDKTGNWVVPYQVAYLPDGQPVSQTALLQSTPSPYIEVGQSNWWEWTYGAVRLLDREVTSSGPLRDRLQTLKSAVGNVPPNWSWAGWWATR